jgi:tetratricopeptide (TPR) repeat protein
MQQLMTIKTGWVTICILFLLQMALSSCAYTSKITEKFLPDAEFKTLVVKADGAMQDAEYTKAAEIYGKAILLRPDDLSLKLKQAKAYQGAGNLAQAYNLFQVIIEAEVPSSDPNAAEIKKFAVFEQAKLGFKLEPIDRGLQQKNSQDIVPKSDAAEAAPPVSDHNSPEVINQLPENSKDQEVIAPAAISSSPMILQSKEAMAVVAGWSDAWMNKNIDLYFSYYVNNFSGSFADAKSWRQSRKSKILNAEQIKIELSDIQFINHNEDKVEVSFIQHYQSGNYKDNGRKVLHMKKIKGHWLIAQEVFN